MASRLERHPLRLALRPAAGGGALTAVVAWLRLCLARRREQIDLRELSDHRLRDLGMTRHQAEREARRQPWQGFDRR